MVLRQLNIMNDGDIVKEGHLKRLKTHKKRYFVLRSSPMKGKSRLEYYESAKKYRQSSSPKRVIYLANCLNIARKDDSKYKSVFVLYTHEDAFGLVAETEDELNSWLKSLKINQRKDEILNASVAMWHVSVKPRGLGTSKNLSGQYDLQLASDTLTLVRRATRDTAAEIQLVNIRRCGHTDCFFFMELGRSASTGAGEIWIQVDDQVIAQNMHEAILGAMHHISLSDMRPKTRRRCASEGKRGKSRPRPVSAVLYPPSRGRADTEPSSPLSSYRVTSASSTKNLSLSESPKSKQLPGLNRFLPRRKSKDVTSLDSSISNQEETNSDFSDKVLVKPFSSSRPSSEEKDFQPEYVNLGAESTEEALSSEDYMKMALDRRHSNDSYLAMDLSKAVRDDDSQGTTKATQTTPERGYMNMTSLRQQAVNHVTPNATPKLQNSGMRSEIVRQKKTSSPRQLRASESPLPNKPDIREFVSLKKSPSSTRRNSSQDYVSMSPVAVRKDQTPTYVNFVPGTKLSGNSSSSELINNHEGHPIYVNFIPRGNVEKGGTRLESRSHQKCPEISIDSSSYEEMHCYVNFTPYKNHDQISVSNNFRKHSLESILTEHSREYVNVDLSGIAKSKSAVDMPEYVNFTSGRLIENGKCDSFVSNGESDTSVQQEVDYVNYSSGKLEVTNRKWRRPPRFGRRESEPAMLRPFPRNVKSVPHSPKGNEEPAELHYVVLDLSKNEKKEPDSPSRRRPRPPNIDLSSCARWAPGPKSAPVASPYAEVDFTKSDGIRQARQEIREPTNTAV